jgi:hypothetical protein
MYEKLNGNLSRLEQIQKVLLSAHAGKVPDNYVNILVEEIKFLWGERNSKPKSKKIHKTTREKSNDLIPKDKGNDWPTY